jgi:large subunit ribosomal protein LP2
MDCSKLPNEHSADIQMKHIAAYLLLQTGGNASPSAADIKSLLETVGIEADQAQLDKLISELEGKDINQVRLSSGLARALLHCKGIKADNQLISEGSAKLASVPSGGGGGSAPAAAAAGGAAPEAAKAEEKKEEAKEESDDDMVSSLAERKQI